jgi:SAM-dependent methyltransferase
VEPATETGFPAGRDAAGGAPHVANLSRVYSQETWRVYDLLDRSLDPRGPDWLLDRAGQLLASGSTLLDFGCRDAYHLIRLVHDNDVTAVGVEPVAIHVEQARAAVTEARLDQRIQIVHGTMEDCTLPDGHFDLVWCRDVLEQVDPLVPALRQVARVLRPDGHMLVYTTVTTDLLEPGEAAMLSRHLGNVAANLTERALATAFDAAGLAIDDRDVIGSEWHEYLEERTQPISRTLLRLSRLRRQQEQITTHHGEDIYHHIEANLHWEVFLLLGKLCPIFYLLRPVTTVAGRERRPAQADNSPALGQSTASEPDPPDVLSGRWT